MTTQEVKATLLNQKVNFGNPAANWWAIGRPKENFFMIVFDNKGRYYKNIDSFSKRISQLIKRGY